MVITKFLEILINFDFVVALYLKGTVRKVLNCFKIHSNDMKIAIAVQKPSCERIVYFQQIYMFTLSMACQTILQTGEWTKQRPKKL